MKYNLVILFLFCIAFANAQSKDEKELIEKTLDGKTLAEKTLLLSQTVFGTKDSLTLEKLFAKALSYGHSHGNIQTRDEAMKALVQNQSKYSSTAISDIKIFSAGETAIVRHLYKAKETKKDGSVTDLNLSLMLVWIKEGKEWKLMGRQAVGL
ncbi:MAG TPA: nuclear transport factor 2 family protein [Cyclobacteriaceae bacterium]|jgi:hypothetical protein|nr:nuclear transport factor 2 family protein [Cyclobacteriaceae bacterium]